MNKELDRRGDVHPNNPEELLNNEVRRRKNIVSISLDTTDSTYCLSHEVKQPHERPWTSAGSLQQLPTTQGTGVYAAHFAAVNIRNPRHNENRRTRE